MANPYQLFSNRSLDEQWQRSLDQRYLIDSVDDIVKQQTADYNNTLREVSEQQAEIMRASTEAICGTISEGLADVTEGLYGVENAIYGLTNLLDSHLKTIIDQLKFNNILSQNIALLLRKSDSAKKRQENIEQGLKFFNASSRNPVFFDDALLFLKDAIDREKGGDHTDYFVLHNIGLIYLHSDEAHRNYDEAIKYFEKAAAYSEADEHPDAIRLANILEGDITQPLSSQYRTIDNINKLTGRSFMQISIAYYRQGKLPESIEYGERAFKTAPSLLEAGVTWAKSLAASGQNDKAARILKPIIQQDKLFFSQTLTDPDFATKLEILQMNEELKLEEQNNSLALLEKSSQLKENRINEWKVLETSLANDFKEICKNIETAVGCRNKKNYLSYLKAKEYLNHFISNV